MLPKLGKPTCGGYVYRFMIKKLREALPILGRIVWSHQLAITLT